jgi:hypothetical protein
MSIVLKPETETLLINRAAAKGYNIDDYIKKLVEEDCDKMRTIDEIFAPFRKNIEESGISEDELDELFLKARKEVYAQKKARLKR